MIRPVESPAPPEVLQQAQPAPAERPSGKDFATLHAEALARQKAASGGGGSGGTAAGPGGAGSGSGGAAGGPGGAAPGSGGAAPAGTPAGDASPAATTSTGGTPAPGSPATSASGSTADAKRAKGIADDPADSRYPGARAAGSKPSEAELAKVEAPEGETWGATRPGAHYAEILTGPRAGQFINLTRGERRGQVFTIERRGDKTFHVYGELDTKVEVSARADIRDGEGTSRRVNRSDQPRGSERWAPVEGHSTYADILNGRRNGLYVNISGGVRDGMAFQIIKKDDKWYHVYGSGKDRQWIRVADKDRAEPGQAGPAASTGGNAPPTASGVGSAQSGSGASSNGGSSNGGSTASASSAGTGGVAAPGS